MQNYNKNKKRYNSRKRGFHQRQNHNRKYRTKRYTAKIDPTKYIAKSEKDFVPKSIYVDDQYYIDFKLNHILQQNIKRKGYTHPTRIQSQIIPHALQGKDILGLANTGSGKTAAFLIPLIQIFTENRNSRCLIIVPTRELAIQIQDEFRILAYNTGLYSAVIIGGKNIQTQIAKLKRSPEFVIGTPGRLKDLSQRKFLKLSKFSYIVLDEVDRMLDMGFLPDVSFLTKQLINKKQTMLFSATMTKDAEKVAYSLMKNPIKIQTEEESPLKSIDQDIIKFKNRQDKQQRLITLLHTNNVNKTLIFTRTKRDADNLARFLREKNFRAEAIHGDKTQGRRSKILRAFKNDNLSILVATDVAARGLDIPNVSHVINYDEPANYKDYIHRIGRTGRAGKIGNAITFVHQNS